jgi:lipoyl(octanoyl) transferase
MDAYSFIDEPRSGLMNMAIDDAMLEFADEHRVVLLRLYQWAEPTLSLGYFQRASDRELHLPSSHLQMVRRTTGGGAIVHHHDLTYSLAVPQSSSSVGAAPAIYEAVHRVIVEWLRELGLAAQQWRETYNLQTTTVAATATSKAEFLCFHRRSEGDVVVGEHKVLGSAQRRSQGALLQHGSLLIAQSVHAESLLGLREILQDEPELLASWRLFSEEVRRRIQRGIDGLLEVRFQCDPRLTDEMQKRAIAKVARFAAAEWRNRV